MHELVLKEFRAWLAEQEGNIPFMYMDNKGYVTIGMGMKINTESELGPWINPSLYRHKKGKVLTTQEMKKQIREDWTNVKKLWYKGATEAAVKWKCDQNTMLRLTEVGLSKKLAAEVGWRERMLKNSYWFRSFELFPADAQLALLDLSWWLPGALKTGSEPFGALCRACRRFDFVTAAKQCRRFAAKPSRKEGRQSMFTNAAFVLYDKFVNKSNRPLRDLAYPEIESLPAGDEDWKPPEGWQPTKEWLS